MLQVMDTPQRHLPLAGLPRLMDSKGASHAAVGFVYREEHRTQIRYTPERPLEQMPDAPALKREPRSGQLRLLFLLPESAEPLWLYIGEQKVEEWPAKIKHIEFFQRK
jgi:hypothetical protein